MSVIAVVGGLVLSTVILSLVAVRVRRAGDAQSLALRASDVVAQTQGLLSGPDFLWAVWQKTTGLSSMELLIRDHRDDVVSTVVVSTAPLDGVLKRFELAGRHYEIRKPSALAKRMQLCEAGHAEVLLSAEHTTFRTTFFRGEGPEVRFALSSGLTPSRYRALTIGEHEVGKVIAGIRRDHTARILSMPDDQYTMLERVFVLAS